MGADSMFFFPRLMWRCREADMEGSTVDSACGNEFVTGVQLTGSLASTRLVSRPLCALVLALLLYVFTHASLLVGLSQSTIIVAPWHYVASMHQSWVLLIPRLLLLRIFVLPRSTKVDC